MDCLPLRFNQTQDCRIGPVGDPSRRREKQDKPADSHDQKRDHDIKACECPPVEFLVHNFSLIRS